MKHVSRVEETVNATTIPSGSRIYCSGNAATPQVPLRQLTTDESIRNVELFGVFFLGNIECCSPGRTGSLGTIAEAHL